MDDVVEDVHKVETEEHVARLDMWLVSLAREETALRLRLGQALEVIGRGAVFDLGFSSLAAYAVERCECSPRWAEGARCLARRVEKLPDLRHAMITGSVSWTMGEVLARVAHPEDEARWLELAEGRTVRQMRVLAIEAESRAHPAGSAVSAAGTAASAVSAASAELEAPAAAVSEATSPTQASNAVSDEKTACTERGSECSECGESCECDEICTLTCTVDREEAWLFEATRSLLEQLGVHGAGAQADALLAEAQGMLLELLPKEAVEIGRLQSNDAAQAHWLSERRRWRAEAEERCESRIARAHLSRSALQLSALPHSAVPPSSLQGPPTIGNAAATRGALAIAAAGGMSSLERASSKELDEHVRALRVALARHELELSQWALRFHRADGWRRLGYATETQYARERLGMSLSSLLARRSLAVRLEKLPVVAAALGAGQIGVEAAMQLVRVATANTEVAWVARARKRTIKHLKEEVAAALTAVRWSGERDCLPPAESELADFQALERAVVSGRIHPFGAVTGQRELADRRTTGTSHVPEPPSDQRRPWWVMLASLASWLDDGFQMSAAGKTSGRRATSTAGRVTLRLRMSRVTRAWWRELEAQARRWLPPTISWLRFACSSLWRAWKHLLGADIAYGRIYVRDRYRCTSPVCNRRDVTPHHLRFRSAGGTDDDYNITTICTWCHLHGVHGGRIRARGTAACIHWELGAASSPCLVVNGRERVAALS